MSRLWLQAKEEGFPRFRQIEGLNVQTKKHNCTSRITAGGRTEGRQAESAKKKLQRGSTLFEFKKCVHAGGARPKQKKPPRINIAREREGPITPASAQGRETGSEGREGVLRFGNQKARAGYVDRRNLIRKRQRVLDGKDKGRMVVVRREKGNHGRYKCGRATSPRMGRCAWGGHI